MKKIFSLFAACVIALAANATDYYFAGAANGWSNNNASWKFVEVDGVLSLEVAELYGEFKIVENGNWHPQHGAQSSGDKLEFGQPYALQKCNGSNDVPNMGINGNFANVTLTLTEDDGNLTITIASAQAAKAKYYLVGAFNNWKLETAVEFVDVESVLTAEVADLSNGFKVVKDRAWTEQWGANWDSTDGIVLGEPYVLGAKQNSDPGNLTLANPFGGYKNAVLTLTTNANEEFVLTLVSGEFAMVEKNWYLPGAWQDWKCDDVAKMDPVEGQANTFEIKLAEFGGEFKVVYGEWAVEFGPAKGSGDTWVINEPMELATPCDNFGPAEDKTYTDVTITLAVDYANVAAVLNITAEDPSTAVDAISTDSKATKTIENGKLVIIHNGTRYNVLGSIEL